MAKRAHRAYTALLATAQRAPRRSALFRTLLERYKDATLVRQGFNEQIMNISSFKRNLHGAKFYVLLEIDPF